jgi:hypothetical protein
MFDRGCYILIGDIIFFDKGYNIYDRGYYIFDRGYCIFDRGYYIFDRGYNKDIPV